MSVAADQELILRADADSRMGIGHVMRCLALAQAWQDIGGRATFAMGTEAPALEARLKSERLDVVNLSVQPGSRDDATQTAALAYTRSAARVVVDGYHFGADYQRWIKQDGLRLLAIDDGGHAAHYCADLVLNQNASAQETLYPSREPWTQLLLGTRFALLRREFVKWQAWQRQTPEIARKILVTLGGGEIPPASLAVLQALEQVEVEGLDIIIVVGERPHAERLDSAVRSGRVRVRVERQPKDMAELMAWADVAVSGAGSTCWELAFMGLSPLLLILADNQRVVAERLEALGVAVDLGSSEQLTVGRVAEAITRLMKDPSRRAAMARRGRELVDGEGARRVASQLGVQGAEATSVVGGTASHTQRHGAVGPQLHLRSIREDDCRLVWEWANDPEARRVSFSSVPIPWEQHVQWFQEKLRDPHCMLYLGVNPDGVPVGQVRYEAGSEGAVVSVTIDRRFRRQGYGSLLLGLSARAYLNASTVETIHAYIKPGNEASVRTFARAGFRELGLTDVRRHRAIHLALHRDGLT